jgi:hypothetical protein
MRWNITLFLFLLKIILKSQQLSFFSAGPIISLNQASLTARRPMVSTVSTQTRPGNYLLSKESDGEKSEKTIRMKKFHLDLTLGLTTRQMLDQMLAENIKWGKFGSITSSALAEENIVGQHLT